jgi:hypothetical protein
VWPESARAMEDLEAVFVLKHLFCKCGIHVFWVIAIINLDWDAFGGITKRNRCF